LKEVIEQLITKYTPVEYVEGNLDLSSNPTTLQPTFQGVTVDEALSTVLEKSADEEFGVNSDMEFIKIYNPGSETIDLSGYSISEGIEFVFPAGSTISMDEKITLVRDISLFPNMTGVVYEWTSGKLANEGEMIALTDNNGIIIDHVDYSPEAPWPVYQAADEYISLISPNLDNHFGTSWFVEVPVQVAAIHKNLNTIFAFPNPATNDISFISDLPLENVQIFDLTGRMLIDCKSNSDPGSIDISALKGGVYIAIVNGTERLKFVKQ